MSRFNAFMMLLVWGSSIITMSGQVRPDSLRSILSSQPDPSTRLNVLHQLASHYGNRNIDSTRQYTLATIELARELNQPETEADALLLLGFGYHNEGQYASAQSYYQQARQLIQSHQLAEVAPTLHNYLGMTYQRIVMPDSALYHFLRAEKAFQAIGAPYEIWTVYNSLFRLNADRADTVQARIYAEKAWEYVSREGNRMDRGYLIFQLMNYFFQISDFPQMARYQSEWQTFQLERKTPIELMQTPEHVALYSFSSPDDPQLEKQMQKALSYFKQQENYYRAGWCAEDIGMLYLKQGERQKAREYMEQALAFYEIDQTGYRRGRVLFQLYQFEKENQRPEQALGYLERFRLLSDSLSGVEVEKNLNELKVQYETEKKEQELRIQGMEIRQKTQERNLLLGSSLFLVLVATGIFLGLRQRIRTNRRLAAQESQLQQQRIQQLEQEKRLGTLKAMIEGQEKERKRIANDLHDSLGGLLSAARNQFDREGKSEATRNILEEAGTELRRISRNLMPRALTLLGLRGALEDLATQLRQQGLACQLQFFNWSDPLSETRTIMLYRIVQELVQNIRKHAQAREVFIQFVQQDQELLVTVEDDGRGFDLGAARQQESLGMSSIESRAKYLNAQLEIDSVPGEGTTVTLRIPL